MKEYKYTFISLMFAALFISGSMAATNYILRLRETRLLTEKGDMKVESPVIEWEGGKNSEESASSTDVNGKKNLLSMKQIEEAVNSWNNRSMITLHDQVAGQISMEEAIENGKNWLNKMGIVDVKKKDSFGVSAELGVGRGKKDTGEREAYFSFWTVTYSSQSMNAVLYLNAVTGNVWGAEIKQYEEQWETLSDDRLQIFVKLAGLQKADDVPPIIDAEETKSVVTIKDSQLYAQELSYEMAISFKNGYQYIAYQLLAKEQSGQAHFNSSQK